MIFPETRSRTLWSDARDVGVFLRILAAVCVVFIVVSLRARQTANAVAALYMLTPALAATITRAFRRNGS